MGHKQKVVEATETVAFQINDVINNIADKMEKPAAAAMDLAQYGFEQYVQYIFAAGIAGTISALILLVISVWCGKFAIDKLKGGLKTDRHGWVSGQDIAVVVIGLIVFVVGISAALPIAMSALPKLLAPEGLAVLEILKHMR